MFRLDNKISIEVAGVVKDIPSTTHLPVNLFISFSTLNTDLMAGLDIRNWGFRSNGYCYVSANDNEVAGVERALNTIIQRNAIEQGDKTEKVRLQPMNDIHFNTIYEDSNPGYTVSRGYLNMLLILGCFIILIACVNYINLSTSLAFTKSKEVGIRKTIGASRQQLFLHYLFETFLTAGIAALLGLALAAIVLPTINTILDKSISFSQVLDTRFVITAIISLVIIAFLSGAYPAVVLSGFNPIRSLKNQLNLPGRSSTVFRKALVVFQFTTSIALIICTIVIARQVDFFGKKSLGFNKESVIEVLLPGSDSARMAHFRSLLQNQAGISNISFCLGAPISDNGINTSIKAEELAPGKKYDIKLIPCDLNYQATYGLQLVAGRWFHPGEEKNQGASMVVNETTVKLLGYKNAQDALGKKISIGVNDYAPSIIGVTKDFHTSSLHDAILPTALLPFQPFYFAAGIRINPTGVPAALHAVEAAWKNVYPDDPFEYRFIDESLAKLYKQDVKDFKLFKAFSFISIFICCIGLWGLIAFVVVRKTKEIGIRKVLGASISSIVGLLSKDFLLLVVLALVIASPIAWYFMNKWLQNFVYRTDIGWWMFLVAGFFAVAIAMLTISVQGIKAALMNPVKSLRSE